MNSFLRLAVICSLLFFLMGQKGDQVAEIKSARQVPAEVGWLQAKEGILPANIKGLERPFSLDLKADYGMNRHSLFLQLSGEFPDIHPRLRWLCTRYFKYKPLIRRHHFRLLQRPEKGEIPLSA
jgi:hypothetical protein